MRKRTIADKIAQKAFQSKEVQKSWAIHEKAFGPILNPSFVDNYPAKVEICAILNLISTQKLQEAMNKMQRFEKFIETDQDKACFMFILALIYEYAGMSDQATTCYNECNSYKHNFYMPYLKVAKLAQEDCIDAAVTNYEEAIRCLKDSQEFETIIASVYTNYASCLLMKHELDQAKYYLDESVKLLNVQPGRESIQAIYYALSEDYEQANEYLNKIENHQLFTHTKTVVQDIMNQKHFQYHEFEINEYYIQEFWEWFIENEKDLRNRFDHKDNEYVIENIEKHLLKIFDFLKKEVAIGILIDDGKYQLEFCDNYAVAIHKGLEKLLSQSPKLENWNFKIVH